MHCRGGTHPPPLESREGTWEGAKPFGMSELLDELLTGGVVEFRAQGLVAGQDDIVGGQLPRGDILLGHAMVVEHSQGPGLGVLGYLLSPLGEDGLGTDNEGRLARRSLPEKTHQVSKGI